MSDSLPSRRLCLLIATLLLWCSAAKSWADVRLPKLLSSHMVLQRDTAVPLWGWAEPGERVIILLDEKEVAACTAGPDGKWRASLPPHAAGGPVSIVLRGKNTITLTDVLFGEVWVCSGQSNMLFELREGRDAEQEIAAARHPQIRLFSVGLMPADTPQEDCDILSKGGGSERFNKWVECSPRTVPTFSAVGYYFARELQKELNVPIGVIHASWGGTGAEVWTPIEILKSDNEFSPIVDRLTDYPRHYADELRPRYERELATWQAAVATAKAAGKPEPRQPRPPYEPGKHPRLPTVLYNGMIHPLIPYRIRGVAWYQGENNADRAYQYRKLLPAMIASWRQRWGQGDYPFGMVQLANFHTPATQPTGSDWAELREAQMLVAQTVPNCGLITAIDLGEADTIHPPNKQDVGKRLASWALGEVYGHHVAWRGPTYERMTIEGSAIRIKFGPGGTGLRAMGEKLEGFQIAGADRKFIWADARIEGETVLVSSRDVESPVAVRYAWAKNPKATLYNDAGLPAFPFRTDNWPGVTVDKR